MDKKTFLHWSAVAVISLLVAWLIIRGGGFSFGLPQGEREESVTSIPYLGFSPSEITWKYIEKESRLNSIDRARGCCTPRANEFAAPIREFNHKVSLDVGKELEVRIPLDEWRDHGWIEARTTPWAHRSLPRWIQVQAGYNQYGPIYLMAELTSKGYATRKKVDGKTLVDGREVIQHIDWKTGVAVNNFTAFQLGYHRLYKVATKPGTWPSAAVSAGISYWNKGKAF